MRYDTFSPHIIILVILNICTKFHENILDSIKSYTADTIFKGKISKGHNSVKIQVELCFFFSTSSDDGLYLYIVSSK